MDNHQIKLLVNPTKEDAVLLSQIAQSSKAFWGYPSEWLALWKPDLTFSISYLASHTVYILQTLPEQQTIGVCITVEEPPHLWIEHLWLLPDQIGKGFGKALLEHAITNTTLPVHQSVKVIADPNAAPFYAARGFQFIGHHPSTPGDRQLPIMERPLP
ncbi:MAG: GNAT family N-acetyltransferase [Saprospiraceae bacterium]|nr:GNAT family N-acetyltransferase [Saprospiraceae bacterium]